MSEPRLLCGIRDGHGKVCGRPAERPTEAYRVSREAEGFVEPGDTFDREGRLVIPGSCSKHGFVFIFGDEYKRAAAAARVFVHLRRLPARRPDSIAHRSQFG